MKKALIIILSILIAASGGLLVYGATLGDPITFGAVDGELLPPVNPDVYAKGIAEWVSLYSETNNHHTLNVATNPSKDPAKFAAEVDGWYDVFGKADPSTSILVRYSGADLVANLMVPITYNQNRAKQFCMASAYMINAENEVSYSDNLRIRVQPRPAYVDYYYRSSAWTGSPLTSLSSLRIRFNDQALKSIGNNVQSYDPDTGVYDVKYKPPTRESTDGELDREVPFKTYDLLNLPIYLGDGDDKSNDYYAKIDSSVVDGSSVRLSVPTDAVPYYILTFSEDLTTAQCKENTQDRLNKTLGGQMKDITIKKADFVVEIWECGLFRRVTADFLVHATISGKSADATIQMEYKFYYDDEHCDLISYIEGSGWAQYFSASNKELFESRKASK